LTIFSSIAYGMSLINMGVSLLLLIGIARVSEIERWYHNHLKKSVRYMPISSLNVSLKQCQDENLMADIVYRDFIRDRCIGRTRPLKTKS